MWAIAFGMIKGLWGFFSGSTIGRVLGGCIAALLALTIYTSFIRHDATQTAVTKTVAAVQKKEEVATKKLEAKQEKVLTIVQQRSQKDVQEIKTLRARNMALLEVIANASHSATSSTCLSADSVRRLAAIH